VPAFLLGIVFGPAASDFMNVSDWDRDGVYHNTYKVAYVRTDIARERYSRQNANGFSGSIAPYHWHSAR
jgi:hypothetical protein